MLYYNLKLGVQNNDGKIHSMYIQAKSLILLGNFNNININFKLTVNRKSVYISFSYVQRLS